MLGSRVGPYEVVEKLGEGAMGEVFLAHDKRLRRRVALKTFVSAKADSSEKALRALHEARAAASLSHPNIAAIHDVIEAGGRTSIVMEYVQGRTLRSLLNAGPLPIAQAVQLGAQLAAGLSYAHQAGVIHRDLKPANVIVTPEGQAKILDFGLAKTFLTRSWWDTQEGEVSVFPIEGKRGAGTPAYMAPEIFRGEQASEASDIYSLGVVLFEMLTGERPFHGGDVESMRQAAATGPVPHAADRNPEVPRALSDLVARAMAIEPRDRPTSAGELMRGLKPFDRTWTAINTPERQVSGQWSSRSRVAMTLALGTALAGSVAVVVALGPSRSTLPSVPGDARHWYTQGTTALREGAYLTAAKRFEKAVSLHDAYPLAHARLAESRAELDDDRAKDSLLRVQELVPDLSRLPADDRLHLEAIRAAVTRRFADAVKVYATIAAAHPMAAAVAQVDLGRAFESNDQLAEAARSYEKAAALDPQSPAAFLGIGSAHAKLLRPERAFEAYERAESLYQAASNVEGLAEVSRRRGDLLARLDRLGEAQTELQRAITLANQAGNMGQHAASLFRLAYVRARQGATAEAEHHAQKAASVGQEVPAVNGDGLIDLGNVFFLRRNFSDARRYFRLALDSARRRSARRTEARALLSLGSLEIQMEDPTTGSAHVN